MKTGFTERQVWEKCIFLHGSLPHLLRISELNREVITVEECCHFNRQVRYMSEKGFMLLYNVNVQTQHPVEIKVNICSLGVVTYFCNGWCCLHRAITYQLDRNVFVCVFVSVLTLPRVINVTQGVPCITVSGRLLSIGEEVGEKSNSFSNGQSH